MTDANPLADYMTANQDTITMMFLYTHPDKDVTKMTDEEIINAMCGWLTELIDEGLRTVCARIEQDIKKGVDE